MKRSQRILRRGAAASLALALLSQSALAAKPFHARRDVDVDMRPSAIAGLPDRRIIVAGNEGLQVRTYDGKRFALTAQRASVNPIKSVATNAIDRTAHVAYAIAGERSVHVAPVTPRGMLGAEATVEIPGRPRSIVAFPNGFVVVHSGGVSLIGKDEGSAFAAVAVSSIGSAVDAVAGDLDGDGTADLILADEPLGELVILRNPGGGAPQKPRTVRTQRAPQRVAMADVDGDGSAEVVVLGALGISIHQRAADGRLTEEIPIIESPHLIGLAVGDLDRNGIDDILYSNRSRTTVSLLLGHRSGRLVAGPSFLTGTGPGPIITHQLTSEDREDIIVANQISGSLTHLAHDHRGLAGVAVLAASIGPLSSAAAADFNGDGHLDLALVSDETGRLEIHLGSGNGAFAAQPSFPIGMTPRSIVAGDWDGDGRVDLAIADFGDDSIAILYGNGRGDFSVPTLVAVGVGPSTVIHGDFGGPAQSDLAVANRLSDSVSILHGTAGGKFRVAENLPVGPRPGILLTGDVDGDGVDDLIAANRQYETITVLPRKGPGFGEAYNKVLGDAPISPATIDLDGKGALELVATKSSEDVVVVLEHGKKGLRKLQTIAVGRGPSFVEIGDFDGNQRDDLAVVHGKSGTVAIVLQLDRE